MAKFDKMMHPSGGGHEIDVPGKGAEKNPTLTAGKGGDKDPQSGAGKGSGKGEF